MPQAEMRSQPVSEIDEPHRRRNARNDDFSSRRRSRSRGRKRENQGAHRVPRRSRSRARRRHGDRMHSQRRGRATSTARLAPAAHRPQSSGAMPRSRAGAPGTDGTHAPRPSTMSRVTGLLHGSVSRQAPSLAPLLEGLSIRFLPGPRRNKAAFLAHAAFAAGTATSSIWSELTSTSARDASQCTIQTPAGPVRLELARGRRARDSGAKAAGRGGDRGGRLGLGRGRGRLGALRLERAPLRRPRPTTLPEGPTAPEAAAAERSPGRAAGHSASERVDSAPHPPPATAGLPAVLQDRCLVYEQSTADTAADCSICFQPLQEGQTLQRLPVYTYFTMPAPAGGGPRNV